MIVQANGKFCLDVNHASYHNGSKIITWLTEHKPNQTWNILPV